MAGGWVARVDDVSAAWDQALYEDAEWVLQKKREEAGRLGYGRPHGLDPAVPYVCPTCFALVALSAVRRHADWHADLAQNR